MTPKEKAEELVEKYLIEYCNKDLEFAKANMPISLALNKSFALIAVDEILKSMAIQQCNEDEYWQEVKNEIERL